MTLHLYALLEAPLVRTPRGAFREPLVQVEVASLVAVAGEPAAAPRDDTADALAHARVVGELASCASAILPVRYGVRFADPESVQSALAAQRDALCSALERVRGCVELSLSAVFPPEDAERAPSTGREYLEHRLHETRRIDALVAGVHTPLAALARDARLRSSTTPLRFAASYLVRWEDLAAFTERADAVAASAEVAVVRGGPWPPYSFVEEAA